MTWLVEGKDGFDFDAGYYPLGQADNEAVARLIADDRLADLDRLQPSAGGQGGIQDRVYVVHPGGRRERVMTRLPRDAAGYRPGEGEWWPGCTDR